MQVNFHSSFFQKHGPHQKFQRTISRKVGGSTGKLDFITRGDEILTQGKQSKHWERDVSSITMLAGVEDSPGP